MNRNKQILNNSITSLFGAFGVLVLLCASQLKRDWATSPLGLLVMLVILLFVIGSLITISYLSNKSILDDNPVEKKKFIKSLIIKSSLVLTLYLILAIIGITQF
jgi:hypothetical protein